MTMSPSFGSPLYGASVAAARHEANRLRAALLGRPVSAPEGASVAGPVR